MQLTEVPQIRSLKFPLKEVVLVDFSWLLYRSHYAYSDMTAIVGGKRVSTGDIFGVLRSIAMLANRMPFASIILCVDSRDPDKKDLHPGYKANRDHKFNVYLKQNEILSAASLLPNVFISGHPRKEADEVIFTLSQKFKSLLSVLIYSVDKDLYQALGDNVCMFNKNKSGKFLIFGEDYAKKKFFDIPVDRIPFLRSICSMDPSDNLPAYPRFPRKLAVEIVKKFKTPEEFLESDSKFEVCFAKSHAKWIQVILKNPSIMTTLYKVHKCTSIPDVRIYRAEGSVEPFQKYNCRETYSRFKRFIENSDGV